jgi:hypothetical protein
MRTIAVWATVFLGLGLLRTMTLEVRPPRERVLIQSVSNGTAVLVRSSGAAYLVETDAGCLSLPQYQGRRIVIDAPELVWDRDSKLQIPGLDQTCRLRNAREIEPPGRPSGE